MRTGSGSRKGQQSSYFPYWHLEPFGLAASDIGIFVPKGMKIGTVANLGSNTHFHLGLRLGNYTDTAIAGALPQTNCGGYPAMPENFVDPENNQVVTFR